jgi:hypothetical protein
MTRAIKLATYSVLFWLLGFLFSGLEKVMKEEDLAELHLTRWALRLAAKVGVGAV